MVRRAFAFALLLPAFACARSGVSTNPDAAPAAGQAEVESMAAIGTGDAPDLRAANLANNAFYYYEDLGRAYKFYTEVLGFELAADYGFAKILQVAPSSYLTLVDAAKGMHSAAEPKTVTLELFTENVEGWAQYLESAGVAMYRAYTGRARGVVENFVAVDPEGYLLKFVQPMARPDNAKLMAVLAHAEAKGPTAGSQRPSHLGINGSILWLYYTELAVAEHFYETSLGLRPVMENDGATVYQSAPQAFVGLSNGADGLRMATVKQGVTASFFVRDVDRWFATMKGQPNFVLKRPRIGVESDAVRTFVGFDPGGYYLEFDTFLAHPRNATLVSRLSCGEGAACGQAPKGPAHDLRAYRLGSISAFAEMVEVGLKALALSAPMHPAELDLMLPKAEEIAERYGVQLYREADFMVTDLFPAEVTANKQVLFIYRGDTLQKYLTLKSDKAALEAKGLYEGEARRAIAERMGALLSYPPEAIEKRLAASGRSAAADDS